MRAPATSPGPVPSADARAPRARHVRAQLEAAIDSGRYPAGQRIPSERALAVELGVSRVAVREAIRSLEALGRVEVRRGAGCFVAAGDQGEAMARWLAGHREQALDLLLVRRSLEELAAAEASHNATRDDLARIRAARDAFAGAVERGEAFSRLTELDVDFHQAIAEASASPLTARLLQECSSSLHTTRRAAVAPDGHPQRSAREHDAIVRAIEREDAQAARRAAARHVDRARAAVGALGRS